MRFHRVMVECVLGRELTEKEQVDHKDRDRGNNSPANLRVTNNSGNGHNKEAPCGGVAWHARDELWCAHTKENGKNIPLGYRRNKSDALALYAAAKAKRLARLDAESPTLDTYMRRG